MTCQNCECDECTEKTIEDKQISCPICGGLEFVPNNKRSVRCVGCNYGITFILRSDLE